MENGKKQSLLDKWMKGECTPEEKMRLLEWLGDEHPDHNTMQLIEQWFAKPVDTNYLDPEILASLESKLPLILAKNKDEKVIHHINSRKNWLPYAAAVIFTIGLGTYFLVDRPATTGIVHTNPAPVQNNVTPGGNRAILTLADGSKIILDSAANGVLAKQGTTVVAKKDGQVVYKSGDGRRQTEGISYNTMATPRGGQYQLQLPDGSRVWLNAASSITYPTIFTGRERRVSISGEVYFEVAKDKTKPFIVKVSPAGGGVREANGGGLVIEVLGTHFNINCYQEEPTINTTLIEGSIRLTSHVSRLTNSDLNMKQNPVHTSLVLKPGQQGQLFEDSRQLSLAVNPNLEQVMAWKNGKFEFNGNNIEWVMRQLMRWYDVDVSYEGEKPIANFQGSISRQENLLQVLKMLELTDAVKFRVEGKRIIVSK